MNHKDTIQNALKTLVQKRYDDPEFQEEIQTYSHTIQFIFTDLEKSYNIAIDQGNITYPSNTEIKSPDIVVITESPIFFDMINEKINPLTAYATGKLKVKGKLTDLIKLQKLL